MPRTQSHLDQLERFEENVGMVIACLQVDYPDSRYFLDRVIDEVYEITRSCRKEMQRVSALEGQPLLEECKLQVENTLYKAARKAIQQTILHRGNRMRIFDAIRMN